MRPLRSGPTILAVTAALALAGCVDSTPLTAPEEIHPAGSKIEGLGTGLGALPVLKRSEALDEELVASRVIGRWGGVVKLGDAGLWLVVPPRALRRSTRITVTAPAGELVGYHFEPHGLRFRRPVFVVQDLGKTAAGNQAASRDDLVGAYFSGDLRPAIRPLEVFRRDGGNGGGAFVFLIRHFSGYVIATG